MPSLLSRTVKSVDVESIQPHPKNARRGDIEAIAESLNVNGQFAPLVVQESTAYVLAGNHTLLAARSLGWSKVSAVFVDVDDKAAKKIMLAANRTSDMGWYDNDALANLLRDMGEEDLMGTLYSAADVDVLLSTLGSEDNNSIGGTQNAQTPGDRSESHDANPIRSIILPLGLQDYEETVARLIRLRSEWELESNTEVVLRALALAEQ